MTWRHEGEQGWTLLEYGCRYGEMSQVRPLVEAGADVNSCDENGWNCLHISAWLSRVEAVTLLLEHGAGQSVNVKNNDGNTPLMIACSKESKSVVNALLRAGAEWHHDENNGHGCVVKGILQTDSDNVGWAVRKWPIPILCGLAAVERARESGRDDLAEVLVEAGFWKCAGCFILRDPTSEW